LRGSEGFGVRLWRFLSIPPHPQGASLASRGGVSGHVLIKPGGILVTSVSEPLPVQPPSNGVRSVFFLVDVTTARLDTIRDLFDQGKLTAQVGSVLPLEQARLAHEMLGGAPHKRGKIVLTVAAPA
jgi:NADPH:quinone reductase-like Zn-dependent oxidoreductase